MRLLTFLGLCCIACVSATFLSAAELKFEPQEIETKLTVGYAVSLCDVNGDGRTDIVVVDSDRVLWYENPTWKPRTIIGKGQTLRDNVCIVPLDIDGDKQLDFALGADWRPFDTNKGGTLQWLQRGKSLDENWTVHPITTEPTIHRMRAADFDGDGKIELLASPLMGRGTTKPNFAEAGVRTMLFPLPSDPVKGLWTPRVINDDLHVTHNAWPCDIDGDGKLELLIVSFEGVFRLDPTPTGPWKKTKLGEGNQATSPNRGASEVKLGRLANKLPYIATIEPWHGFQVVVYTPSKDPNDLWTRVLVDDELLWGHAVWCANMDDDADEELIIGVRDHKDATHRSGIRVYDPTPDATAPGGVRWERQIVDPAGVAVEDAAAADLDGDGKTDIVACGRATKNVKIYWNRGAK